MAFDEATLNDLITRLTTLETAGPDPRIAEALETAQRALSSAATAAEKAEAVAEVKAALARLEKGKGARPVQLPAEPEPEPSDDPASGNPPGTPASNLSPGANPTPPRRRTSFW